MKIKAWIVFIAIWCSLVIFTGCDTAHTFDGRLVIVIECDLPGDLCDASDEEFAAFWDALDEGEQYEFVEEWGKPKLRSGFVVARPKERKP